MSSKKVHFDSAHGQDSKAPSEELSFESFEKFIESLVSQNYLTLSLFHEFNLQKQLNAATSAHDAEEKKLIIDLSKYSASIVSFLKVDNNFMKFWDELVNRNADIDIACGAVLLEVFRHFVELVNYIQLPKVFDYFSIMLDNMIDDNVCWFEILNRQNYRYKLEFMIFEYLPLIFENGQFINERLWKSLGSQSFFLKIFKFIIKYSKYEVMNQSLLLNMFRCIAKVINKCTPNISNNLLSTEHYADVIWELMLAVTPLESIVSEEETGELTSCIFNIVSYDNELDIEDPKERHKQQRGAIDSLLDFYKKYSFMMQEDDLNELIYLIHHPAFKPSDHDFSKISSIIELVRHFKKNKHTLYSGFEQSLVHMRVSLPNIVLKKSMHGSFSSPHTSKHKPIDDVIQMKVGKVVDTNYLNFRGNSAYIHELLISHVHVLESGERQVVYSSEVCLVHLVRQVFSDVLNMLGVSNICNILHERPDMFILKSRNGRVIAMIEVKTNVKTNDESLLNNSEVIGQCLDYLLNCKIFSGQRHCPLISTNLEEFRFFCLKESQSYFESDTIDDEDDNSEYFASLSLNDKGDSSRVVCGTEIMFGSDTNCLSTLFSVIKKALKSPIDPVILFEDRIYNGWDNDVWHWRKPDAIQKFLSKKDGVDGVHNVLIGDVPFAQSQHFYILRHIDDVREDGKVALTLAGYRFCVVKLFEDAASRDNEFKHWQTINNVTCLTKKLLNKEALIMPYIITFLSSAYDYELCWDISKWGSPSFGIVTCSDVVVEEINSRIHNLLENYRKKQSTDMESVYGLAKKTLPPGISHGDPRPGNIGLMIVGDELKPCFIDFERMDQSNNACEEAMDKLWAQNVVKVSKEG